MQSFNASPSSAPQVDLGHPNTLFPTHIHTEKEDKKGYRYIQFLRPLVDDPENHHHSVGKHRENRPAASVIYSYITNTYTHKAYTCRYKPQCKRRSVKLIEKSFGCNQMLFHTTAGLHHSFKSPGTMIAYWIALKVDVYPVLLSFLPFLCLASCQAKPQWKTTFFCVLLWKQCGHLY